MTDAHFWDRIAPKYAKSPIKDMSSYERTLERAATYLRQDDQVLEIGCGTGTTALRLAPHAGHIIATDISAGMIDIAASKARDENRANVTFRQAPADARDFGPVHVAMAFNLMHLVPNLNRMLHAVHEQLVPGGYFISKTPCLGEMSFFLKILIPVLQKIGKAPFVSFQTVSELEQAITEAGFAIVESSNLPANKRNRFIVARKI